MKSNSNLSTVRNAKDGVQIVLGCVLGALAYPLFLVPNNIAPGGVTGLATILNYLSGWPVGITSLVMNIPIFVFGYRFMGKHFVGRTLAATFLFSLLIDLMKVEPMTDDPMMAAIFGGALLGIGLAFIMRGGATTGGTDMLARMLHRHVSFISVGAFLFAFDVAVVTLAGFTMSVEHAMNAMIAVYITSKVLDTVLAGIGTDKACYIISIEHEKIVRRVLDELERGVTLLDAKGGYSGENVHLILCVVSRMQVTAIKSIVKQEDPDAFIFITEAHETLGEGFHDLSTEHL